MTTQQAIEALHALPRMGQGAPGLARMQNLCDHLGNPEKELQCIHIAGTNGKGSLAAMTSSILTAAGYKTGLTISPYVVDFRERFQIDGEMIPPRTLANLTEKVLDAIDAIEAEGIRRSWRKLDEAGLVLAVFDAAQPLSDDDLELARRCQGRPAIAVLNKQDLAGETDVPRGTLEPYFKKIVPMCARDAVGLQALTDAVADLLGTAQLDPEAAQLCSARQLAAATRARDALAEAIAARQNGFGLDAAAVCLTDALQALFDLTGENASDATIEEVFETFCVGK